MRPQRRRPDRDRAGAPTIFRYASLALHPSWRDASLDEDQKQDLALLRLEGAGPSGGAAARLPIQWGLDDIKSAGTLAANGVVTVVGYGGTVTVQDPDTPLEVYRQRNNNKDRHSTPADVMRVTPSLVDINVSLNRGQGGSICYGDSGGGVFFKDLLVGIVRESDRRCSRDIRATRLDTPPVRSWLALQGVSLPAADDEGASAGRG